jgi:hypothetical protein
VDEFLDALQEEIDGLRKDENVERPVENEKVSFGTP